MQLVHIKYANEIEFQLHSSTCAKNKAHSMKAVKKKKEVEKWKKKASCALIKLIQMVI